MAIIYCYLQSALGGLTDNPTVNPDVHRYSAAESKLKEKRCNLWIESAEWRCIPTPGATNPDGTGVLDHGVAKEAADRFQALEIDLGRLLTSRGNHVHVLRPGLVSFPIKQFLWSGADLRIIGRSAQELMAIVGDAKTLLPRPAGAANDPPWEEVAKVLSCLPDNVIVIEHC